MSLFGKVFNQINPFDHGKTFSNPQPQRPQPKPQPRVNAQQLAQAMQQQQRQAPQPHASVFHNLTHNPLTNLGGDVLKGTYNQAQHAANMVAATPLNVFTPKPQDIVEHTANSIHQQLIKQGVRADHAQQVADAVRVKGYTQVLKDAGIGLNDSKATIGRKAVGNIGGTVANVAPVGEALKAASVAGRVVKGAAFGGAATGIGNLAQDNITPKSELKAIAGGALVGGVLPIGVEGAKLGAKGANAVRKGEAMTTPEVRINIKDQQVLKDLADYRAGAYKPKAPELNKLLRDARAVGQKHGVDLVNGTPKDHIERAANLLDQLGAKNRAIQQGGYAKIPSGKEDPLARLKQNFPEIVAKDSYHNPNTGQLDPVIDYNKTYEKYLVGAKSRNAKPLTKEAYNSKLQSAFVNDKKVSAIPLGKSPQEAPKGKTPQLGEQVPPASPIQPLQTPNIEGKPAVSIQQGIDSTTPQTPIHSPEQGILPQDAGLSAGVGKPITGQQRLPVQSPSQRTNKFITSVMEDPNTNPKIKDSISSLYTVRNTNELQVKAANLVKEHPDVANQLAVNAADDTSVAVAQELIKALQAKGEYTRAIDLVESLSNDLTKAGQTIQAASIYGKLTPEGVLRFTQKEISNYNKATGKNIKLNPTQAEKLTKLAGDIQKLPEGYDKQSAIANLVKEIQYTMPATKAQHLSTLQTMAQLLNPKTNIRNIGGNSMFSGLENVSQTLGTPVDKLLSLVTGKRTTALPSLKTQVKSGVAGGKKAVKEAYQGINTGPNTQYDLNDVPVFRDKILGGLEKTMNATLRGADRAAYQGAFDDSIRASLKLAKTKQVTPDMIEQAHQIGLYRTFQDNNNVSDFFVGMKRSLNKLGIGTEGKRFGLGDIVLKYPKTPGNLLARGIDYSPAGFLKSVFELAKTTTGQEFNQKAFVDSFSRAVVGSSSAFAVGYAMAKNGIITAQPEQNKDLRNLQKTEGLGGYQINVSAFKRWAMSGFNSDAGKIRPGDKLISYDWAQPIAIPVSAGAALGAEKPKKATQAATNTALNSANTLVEQPLLQGLQNLFGGNAKSMGDAVIQTAQSLPSSFTPTIASQANQLMDNSVRNTSDKNPITVAANQVKAKIPGLAQTLPKQVDVLGNDKQRYQNGSNNAFNVLFNPAFVNNYDPNPTAETSMNLYHQTGETKQLPNTVKPTIIVNGKRTQLTGEQQGQYQKYVGQTNTAITNALSVNKRFQNLTDPQKVNMLSSIQTDINTAAKVKLFGDQPAKITTNAQNILDGKSIDVINSKLDNAEKVTTPKVPKVKTSKAKKGKKIKVGKGRKAAKPVAIHFRTPKSIKLSKVPKGQLKKAKQAKFNVATVGKKPKKIKLA